MKWCLRLALFVLVAPLVWAQETPDPIGLYQRHCAQCHGADLDGGMAGGFLDGVWQYGSGAGYLFANIKHGITHMGMPAYESTLADSDVSALVEYLLAAEKSSGVVKPEPPERIQSQEYEIKVDTWVKGLEIPWAIAFPDPETALITERPGRLRVVRNGVLDEAAVTGTPEVLHEGQGGLLDVAVDPDYSVNGWIYLAYSHALPLREGEERPVAMTRIVRGHIQDQHWVDEEVVYEAPHETYVGTRHHYGCRVVFDAGGYLYFSIGERGLQDHAQDPARPNGKVHRIRPDGQVPEDNPFIKTPGALPTLFTLGNRNIQGMSVHPVTGRVWSTEHGPMGGDELNLITPGANYGWPLVTYGRNYNGAIISDRISMPGITEPNLVWRPSIAVCGIEFHQGELFPKWNNKLIVGALRYEEVSLLTLVDDRVIHQETILKNCGRVRDVGCGPDGAVYVVLNDPDTILRLTPLGERRY